MANTKMEWHDIYVRLL